MAGLLPYYLMRQWTNDGKLLSGGHIYFYISGTSTPKPVYQDAGLTVPHTNPVVLDASGTQTIWLGPGAYRVHVKDSTDSQVYPPIDGVIGQEAGAESTARSCFVQTYAELRALSDVYDTVYVGGRLSSGDGGQGWFAHLPGTSSLTDDGGAVLTGGVGSKVYRRVFDGYIDPAWFGVQYGVSVDNTQYINAALTASATLNFPVLFAGSTYINQPLTIPAGSATFFNKDAFLTAGNFSVDINYSAGSSCVSQGVAFGKNVYPLFAVDSVDEILSGWMGGDAGTDEAAHKWSSSALTPQQTLVLDSSLASFSSLTASAPVEWRGGFISFSGAVCALSMPYGFAADTGRQVFSWDSPNNVGAVNIGKDWNNPAWFGSGAAGAKAAVLSGKLRIPADTTFIIPQAVSAGSLSVCGVSSLSRMEIDTSLALSGTFTGRDVTVLVAALASFSCAAYDISNVRGGYQGVYPWPANVTTAYGANAQQQFDNIALPTDSSATFLRTLANGVVAPGYTPSSLVGCGFVWAGATGPTVSQNFSMGSRIRYVNGYWWYLGTKGFLAKSSDDMVTWTTCTTNHTTCIFSDMVYAGGYYLATAYIFDGTSAPLLFRSSNGTTWTSYSISDGSTAQAGNNPVRTLGVSGSTLFVGGSYGYIWTSANYGQTWSAVRINSTSNVTIGWVGYVGNRYVLGDGQGNWWHSTSLAVNSFTQVIAYGGGTSQPGGVLLITYDAYLSAYRVIRYLTSNDQKTTFFIPQAYPDLTTTSGVVEDRTSLVSGMLTDGSTIGLITDACLYKDTLIVGGSTGSTAAGGGFISVTTLGSRQWASPAAPYSGTGVLGGVSLPYYNQTAIGVAAGPDCAVLVNGWGSIFRTV